MWYMVPRLAVDRKDRAHPRFRSCRPFWRRMADSMSETVTDSEARDTDGISHMCVVCSV
jgi:hypothetical protein